MDFGNWYCKKRAMFSPKENKNIGNDGLMRAYVQKIYNDEQAGKPRRDLILIVKSNFKNAINGVYKAIDPIRDTDDVLTQGLSSNGNEPTTHYILSWISCPDFAYKIFEDQSNSPNVMIYNDKDTALQTEGLKEIEPIL